MTKDDKFYELHGVTPPNILAHLVRELPDIPDIDLEDYAEVICDLHDNKGYSFKQVVEFLNGHGLETNRSAVYRCYKYASLPPEEREEPLVDDETGQIVEE